MTMNSKPTFVRSKILPAGGRLSYVAALVLMSSGAAFASSPQLPSTTALAPTAIETATPAASESPAAKTDAEQCREILNGTVRAEKRERLTAVCNRVQRITGCQSVEGRPIYHTDALSTDVRAKRILVLGLIHGDEPLAGEMALEWADRLHGLSAYRNNWRVVPMLNPDGLERKTRMNARGVDLNRNFPTKDWDQLADAYWKKHAKADPRRFPGTGPGSEAETKCAIAHIKNFKPDFVVSVHTPYKVLDFDGPMMTFPRYKDLPWRALGNFPGSLGRYMWKDYQIPVLTVELGERMVDSAQLQDIVGSFAIDAARRAGEKTVSIFEVM